MTTQVGNFTGPQTWTSGANVNPAIPQSDPQAGDLMVAKIAIRPSTVTLATPSGWTLQVNQTGTDGGGEAADTGSVRFYVFTKIADGSEARANVTFTKTGTISVYIGNISHVRSATGTYDVLPLAGSINGDATTWSAAGLGAAGNFTADDLCLIWAAQNGDLSFTSGWDIFGTGLGAPDKSSRPETGEYGSTTGNGVEVGEAVFSIMPGSTNSGTVTLQVTHSVAVSGVIAALRIRQGSGSERTDVWVRAAGVSATGTTSVSVPYCEHRAGDRLIIAVVSRHATDNTPSTPTNWTSLGSWVGGSGADGADSGNARLTMFYRDVSSVITGTEAVSLTSGTSMIGQMVAVAKAAGKTWSTPAAVGAARTVQDPWSLALGSLDIPAAGIAIAACAVNSDVMTGVQTPTLSASGVTFTDVVSTGYFETTTGNDLATALLYSPTGTGATAAPTVGIDWIGTATANAPAGAIGFVAFTASTPSETLDNTITATTDATDVQTWVDVLDSTVTATTDITDLAGRVDSADTTITATTDTLDVAHLVELLDTLVTATTDASDAIKFVEILDTLVTGTTDATDLQRYLDVLDSTVTATTDASDVAHLLEVLDTVIAAATDLVDVQTFAELLDTVIAAATDTSDVARRVDVGDTTVVVTTDTSDVQTWAEVVDTLIAAITDTIDTAITGEVVDSVIVATTDATDVQHWVEVVDSTIGASTAAGDAQRWVEVHDTLITATTSLSDLQRLVEVVDTLVTVTTDAVDLGRFVEVLDTLITATTSIEDVTLLVSRYGGLVLLVRTPARTVTATLTARRDVIERVAARTVIEVK